MSNLIEGIQAECNRVREVIKEYESLPQGAGMIGAALMKHDIQLAEKAIAMGDVLDLLKIYATLKEISK